MDAQAVLIGIAIFIIISIILLVAAFTMREKTYEEVLEEQRKQQEELFGKPKEVKDKKKKKPYKKNKEKIPEKNEGAHVSNLYEHSERKVEIQSDPIIIEPPTEPTQNTPRRRVKKPNPILVNKDEASLVNVATTVPEKFHPAHPPMDDLELKHERERRESGGDTMRATPPPPVETQSLIEKKDKKRKERETKKQQDAAEAVIREEVHISQSTKVEAAPPPKPEGKGRRKTKSPDGGSYCTI